MPDSPGWQSLNEGDRPSRADRPLYPQSALPRGISWRVVSLTVALVVVGAYGILSRLGQGKRIRQLESEVARLELLSQVTSNAVGERLRVAALEEEHDELRVKFAKVVVEAAEVQESLVQELEALRAATAEKPVPVILPPPPSSAPAGASFPAKPTEDKTEGKPEPVVEPPPKPSSPASEPVNPAPEPVKRAPRVPLRPEIEKILRDCLEKLRKDPADRKAATDALMELRRREPKVRDALRWYLEEETDPRVQARIKYVILVAEFLPLWEKSLGQGRLSASEAVANESLLVVGVWSAGFTALKAGTGEQAWAQSNPQAAVYSPVLVGDHVFSAHTSSPQWTLHRTRLSDGKSESLDVKTARGQIRLAGDGAFFVIAPDPAKIECRDVRTGAKRWEAPTLSSYASFAVAPGRAFHIEPQRRLVCTPLATSNALWKSDPGMISVIGVAEDVVLGADQSGELVACDIMTGRVRWRVKMPAARGLMSVRSGAGCAVLSGAGTWLSLDLETGRTLWTRSAATVSTRSGPVVVSGLLAVPEADGVLLIDPRTGQEALRHEFARRQVTSLAAHGDRLFVILRDGAAAFTVR